MREGRVADCHPGRSTMELLEQYLAHGGWTVGKRLDHRVDRVIAQCCQEARLPIVESPFGISCVEHAIELAVTYRADCIHRRRSDRLERPHGPFSRIKRTAM